jgi:transglutaminase-like putative cysteine protease
MPSDADKAVSGISDTVNPGQFSSIALLDEVAFRARFKGQTPEQRDLYWRGPVYWNTDGQAWTREASTSNVSQVQAGAEQETFTHTVTMEPHQQIWLFGLDTPVAAPKGVRISADQQLIMTEKLERTRSFEFTSSPRLLNTSLSTADRKRALALPNETDARVTALAKQWTIAGALPINIVSRGLAHFNQQSFFYTLRPPPLGKDPVAEFLFQTKRGFCGHYATSFAVLMRAAGIPARLVGGYQGGVYNTIGDFWEIRQADAHIWVEVWIEGRGWVRADPTAAIAPSRIENSIDLNQLPNTSSVSFIVNPTAGWGKLALQAQALVHAVDYYWQSGVLAYGPETQGDFLSNVGISGWEDMILWLTVFSVLTLTVLTAYFHLSNHAKPDPAQRIYLAFCKRLAKKVGERRLAESASDYFDRAIEHYPSQAPSLNSIKAQYLRSRYEGVFNNDTFLFATKKFDF